jgi:hypothetical protein
VRRAERQAVFEESIGGGTQVLPNSEKGEPVLSLVAKNGCTDALSWDLGNSPSVHSLLKCLQGVK